jgi:hypothetical protein
VATNEQTCGQISWSSTKLATIFMANFRMLVMENWFSANHGLNFGPTKVRQWLAAQDGRMEKGEEGEIRR